MTRTFVMALLLFLVPSVALADTDADARAVVATWLAAQNSGDFAAYAATYDAKFVGIRRTSAGGEKKMKLKAWKADRKKMFKRTQEVAADDLKVEVKDGTATVRFLQRWKSGSYADHGTKVMKLAPDKKTGKLLIVREELLSSTPGWDDDKSKILDLTAMVSPITVTLLGEGLSDEDGCQSLTWVAYFKDKKKKVVSKELGMGVVMVDTTSGEPADTIEAAPGSDKKGVLFEVGEWCAGGADNYSIKHSGDALIVNYEGVGECPHDEPDCDPTNHDTVLTVKLPEGAKVKAK